LVVVLGAMAQAGAAVMYRVVDLGTLGGSYSVAYGINDLGQVVGGSQLPGNTAGHAFRTAPNQGVNPATDDLGTLGGTHSGAYAINNLGQVAGSSHVLTASGVATHAFRTAPNQPINPATDDLGTLGGSTSRARGINDAGQVVGWSFLGDGSRWGHGFRTAPNQAINAATDDLGTLGGAQSDATAINNHGQVAGWASREDDSHAFRTRPNQPINAATDDLGVLTGLSSSGFAINDAGQVAGTAELEDQDITHLFRTGPNQPINPATDDLGTFGDYWPTVHAMNERGDIVGMLTAPNDDTVAFVYIGSTIYDLNGLIDPASGWLLREAHDINNLGQIVGWGELDGMLPRAFRLDPVPEPSAILLITFGSLTALGRRPRATGR
jgi:probable HAF family extracellular repeat protein